MANVSKEQIKRKLSASMKVKEECISIYGLKTAFGGGRSTGYALIYESLDAKKQYNNKSLMKRVSKHSSHSWEDDFLRFRFGLATLFYTSLFGLVWFLNTNKRGDRWQNWANSTVILG